MIKFLIVIIIIVCVFKIYLYYYWNLDKYLIQNGYTKITTINELFVFPSVMKVAISLISKT